MKNNVGKMTQLALLIALQIVLNVTPLGFIPLGFMHVTLMHLPVIIGALILGPAAGGTLGAVFGITSIITATTRGTLDSIVFTPFLSGSLWSIVIAMVPRILFGIITAYLFKSLVKSKLSLRISAGIAGGLGALLHTIMVLGSIYLFLGDMFANNMKIAQSGLLLYFAGVVGTSGVMEAVVGALAASALIVPLQSYNKSNNKN